MITTETFNVWITKRWLFSCLFLFSITACRENGSDGLARQTAARISKSLPCIDSARYLVQDGDMITRTGIDFISQSLRQFCRNDNTYSHCGIVSIEQRHIFIYHALGGEVNPNQQLKKETLSSFCDALDNQGFGLFRFPLTASQKLALHRQLEQHYQAGLPFDRQFDLHTDSAMYCTEFVAKMLQQASGNSLQFTTSFVNSLEYMAADHLFLHKSCREVHRFVY